MLKAITDFLGCYSTSFRWWDHYMGTDKSYQAYNKKKAAARAAGKGSMTPYVPVRLSCFSSSAL